MVPVPGRTEKLITKSENEDILDHFFAKVVINAVKLILRPVGCKCALKLSGTWEILAERLLDLLRDD